MTFTRQSVALEVVWFDNDVLELKLSASNAGYSGQTTFYASFDEPKAFAAHIEGFPRTVEDVREYELGGTNIPGYGGAKIRLCCRDRSGHLLVHVSIYSIPSSKIEAVQSATVQIDTVPAEIDSFVQQLKNLQVHIGDVAVLPSAT